MPKRKPIIVVQGGQWGSEAKGNIAAALCIRRDADFAIRTGAINAGHTVIYKDQRFAMQQLPTGWVNPRTKLVIGAGAYIHPDTLFREIDQINDAMPGQDVRNRLYIDYRCGIHTEEAEQLSKAANRHHRMGATGKGCSEAIVAKIRNRNDGYKLFSEFGEDDVLPGHPGEYGAVKGCFTDTVELLNGAYDSGHQLMIEGTQGTMLDLHIGPYPYTTSRMTSAANWVSECGLSPALEYEVVLVCRTYPIRVAGNSGPMPLEIEWTDLARSINSKLLVSGRDPLVPHEALEEFEHCLDTAAAIAVTDGRYKVPLRAGFARTFDVQLSKWTPEQRNDYRVAASELHRDAMLLCGDRAVQQLRRLFEMTTVTRKLRRLAEWDTDTVRYAVAINRPSWIALTFLDYVVPELAGARGGSSTGTRPVNHAIDYIDAIQESTGVPVRLVSTGPELENVVGVNTLEAMARL